MKYRVRLANKQVIEFETNETLRINDVVHITTDGASEIDVVLTKTDGTLAGIKCYEGKELFVTHAHGRIL